MVADEFTLMLADHPEYADLFDYVARKGRSFRIHILFASQTLDVGKIKDIDKNTSYRIGLKVASPSISRQIIGVEDAYHVESGREHKGVGFLVPAPGAVPIKFRSTYVDGIYEPPCRATCPIVVHAVPAATAVHRSRGSSRPPESADHRLRRRHRGAAPRASSSRRSATNLPRYGPRAPQLWLPPLDAPLPLEEVLQRAATFPNANGVAPRRYRQTLRDAP